MLEGYDDDEAAVCDNIYDKQHATANLEEFMEPEIMLHALTRWTAPKTMRVTARIGSNAIFTLIDSGSTHNFISECMANLLRLLVVSTKAFTVQVANGENLKCQEKFNEVDLQGFIFSLTLYSLPFTGLDLVLRIQWLELLGSVVCNWKQLTMEFFWANKMEAIDGYEIQAATFKEISKDIGSSGAIYAFCLQITMQDTQAIIQPRMQEVLQEFSDVFMEPFSLPLSRQIDHSIPLKEGTAPVNVRPYRYAHYQKKEIEKLVQEMLNSELVQPSTSPFSSPIILVKKKDGNWRFCTYYRALNATIIKDRFPIPTVEDMLDELYGASYFTKLDLRVGYHQVRASPPDIPKLHSGHIMDIMSTWLCLLAYAMHRLRSK
jgi:hypothetical protein